MTKNTITEKSFYEAIRDHLQGEKVNFSNEDLVAYVEKRLAKLADYREAAKARAAQKRAESDVMASKIYENLTETPVTIDEILKNLDEDVTSQMVVARLTTLVNEGKVVREKIKTPGAEGKRASEKTAYRKA